MFNNIPEIARALVPKDAFTRFAGGMNLETPAWSAPVGQLRDCLNYELGVDQGYQDVKGYERFDGAPAPTDAEFTILDVTITGSIVVDDTVTGVTSTATGYVIATGTYPETPSQAFLVLTKVTGTFDEDDESLEVSAVAEGNTDAEGYQGSGPTAELTAIYNNLAADQYRADVAVVPGEGDVWGGFTLGSLKYAIRNAVGGATAVLHKSDAAGWTAITLNEQLAFTSGGGAYSMVEGDTVTGATSTETAVIERIQVVSGTLGGGDAVGWLTLSAKSGAFQAENLNVGANLDVATIAGDAAAQTLQPGGRLDFDISNFADTQGPDRVYGADGVNFGWEFDGTVFAFLRTGMTDDTPDYVQEHKAHLFFAFDGSVQHSGIGTPFAWTIVLGAAEIQTGRTVTGFHVEPGDAGNDALLIACRQQIFILYGNDTDSWNLVRYREKVGAYAWTIQQVAYTLFLDDRGITDLRTSQAFGNFDHSSLSNLMRRVINAKKPLATASCVVRDKNQYRLFFTDKTAIYATMKGKELMGLMPVTLEHQCTTVWSAEDPDGNEEIYFGADDGYVYQMERGTSFDGANIYAYLYTHWDHGKSIEWEKMYYAPVTLEGRSTGYAEIDLGYELDYGRSEKPQPGTQTALMPASEGNVWDSGISWDTGIVWDDSITVPTVGLDLRGDGRNISWIITKDSDYFEPILLTGVHYRYVPTVQVRG